MLAHVEGHGDMLAPPPAS